MYGTIARLHPLPGRDDELRALSETFERERGQVAGYRASYLFRPDENPYGRPTVFLVAMFDDKATYRANADDPAQDAFYRKMRALLADDPDWADGTFEAF